MIVLALLACTGTATPTLPTAPPTEELSATQLTLAALGETVAEDYAMLAERSATLAEETVGFCGAVSTEGRDAVRQAWWAAREGWKRAEVVQFGPIVDEPVRTGPKVDLWPVRATVVDDFLAHTDPLAADDVAAFGGALKGFPVIEYILWHPERTELPDERTCTYLVGLTADLAFRTAELEEAWSVTRPTLVSPPDDGPYATTQDVLDEWVNRMFFTVENLRFDKLGVPLDGPLPLSAESPYSGRSLVDASDALAGVHQLYVVPLGVRDLVPADRAAALPALDERFEVAKLALAAVPEPLTDAIVNDREAVSAAQDALRDLQIGLQVDLAQALSVTITFNDNDGD